MANSEERFIETADGLKLFVRDHPSHRDAGGVPVICLHGLTRNSKDFDNVAPFMAALGRRVIAIDMRGRGQSERDPQPARYRPDVYAGDVIRILDVLDIPQAVFVGTSMGGIITMVVAAVAANRVAAAVLNDIGAVIDPAGIARIMSYVGKRGPFESWGTVTAAIKDAQSVAYPNADDAFWNRFVRNNAREMPDGTIVMDYDPAVRTAMLQPQPGPPPDLKLLFAALKPKPVLVIRGALSDILAPEGVAVMRAIKPDLEVVEIPGVGHAPILDEPESRAALAAFLSRVP
jgi:pimeloyl-ACP methyl ester carboxylesterase